MKTMLLLLLCGITFCRSWKTNPEPTEVALTTAAEPPAADTIRFTAQIQPILQAKCSPCHFPGGAMYEKMPFDQAATILTHSEGVLNRIKDGEEGRLMRDFVEQAAH